FQVSFPTTERGAPQTRQSFGVAMPTQALREYGKAIDEVGVRTRTVFVETQAQADALAAKFSGKVIPAVEKVFEVEHPVTGLTKIGTQYGEVLDNVEQQTKTVIVSTSQEAERLAAQTGGTIKASLQEGFHVTFPSAQIGTSIRSVGRDIETVFVRS